MEVGISLKTRALTPPYNLRDAHLPFVYLTGLPESLRHYLTCGQLSLCFVKRCRIENDGKGLGGYQRAGVSSHEGTSRKASQSCSHRRALACAVHKYVRSTIRCRRTYVRVRARVCGGNIIANKYLLPVAESINIKEKLPKNWKLSLRAMRERNFCILTVASPPLL